MARGDVKGQVSVELGAGARPRPAYVRPSLLRRVVRAILAVYMRLYHRLELRGAELLPPRGPAIVLLNHASLLDVPALMVLDPYPDTMLVAKASLFKVPGVAWLLRQWDAIAVERQGRDSSGVRALLKALREGHVLAVAAEGRRTRSGRLEPINLVLAKIAVSADVPLIPLGISGSFEALPPGAAFPRPRKMLVRVGEAFRIARGTDAIEAAQRIRAEIARLLPLEQQPLDAAANAAADDADDDDA
jgi:1-acyl-sn-glycerol-3-phosphate acyltransferase